MSLSHITVSCIVLILLPLQSHAITGSKVQEQILLVGITDSHYRHAETSHLTISINEHNHGRKKGLTRWLKSFRKPSSTTPHTPKLKQPKSGERMGIWGLILGVLSIPLFPIVPFGVTAFILGTLSRRQYLEGNHERGKLAKAAIVLGIVSIGLCIALAGLPLVL